MEKRQFLSCATGLVAGALGGLITNAHALSNQSVASQTILTVIGDIKNKNRDEFNGVRDQLMHKQGISFKTAYTFSLADLEKLPTKTISLTLDVDSKVHEFSGPTLLDVLHLVGVIKAKDTTIMFHSVDGYSTQVNLSQANNYNYILATKMDGQLLPIGGFGPIYSIFDVNRVDEFSKKPLNIRFELCLWALYCIEIINEN